MRRLVRLLTATLLCAAFTQFALAQGEETLQRHTVALENLQASVEHLGSDSSASLDALEGAASTMRLVARDTDSSTLVPALEQAFSNARTAITNQSHADLAVQTAVLRGGFQRALLEAALDSGTLEGARPGFSQLATELDLDAGTRDNLAAATNLQALLKHYQAGLAHSIAGQLEAVQAQFPGSQADAYITLADAYGRSLSLQDAPEAPAGLNSGFTELISAVVQADAAMVATATPLLISQLQETADQLSDTAVSSPSTEPTPVVPAAEPEAVGVQPAELPAEPVEAEPVEAEPAVAEPATAEPAQPAVEPEQAPEAAPAEAAEAAQPEDAGQAAEPAADVAAVRAELAAEQEQLAVEALVNDLGRRGLRGQAGENLARQLHSRGFSSVAEVLATGLELASRATDAASVGDQAAARQYLSQLGSHYQTNVNTVASRMDSERDSLINSLLDSLRGSPTLAVTDLQALTSQLAGLGSSSSGATMQRNLQAWAAIWTGGWPRQVLLIIAALLAIVPLVLLRLAFGNTNRNWTLIGGGLLLLLLPLILAGVGALLDLIGQLASVPLLHQIASWLTLTGAAQQIVLTVLLLLAVILLGLGTYGICKQFGLFGGVEGTRRRGRDADRSNKTETRTLVDWDEEF